MSGCSCRRKKWMVLSLPWDTVYGFVYILAWSRLYGPVTT